VLVSGGMLILASSTLEEGINNGYRSRCVRDVSSQIYLERYVVKSAVNNGHQQTIWYDEIKLCVQKTNTTLRLVVKNNHDMLCAPLEKTQTFNFL
jgi:hypothetical protein